MKTTKKWFSKVTGGDSVNGAAKRAGLPQATLNTRLGKGQLLMEDIVSISRAYDHNPIEELVTMGLVSRTEVDAIARAQGLKDATDEEIVAEVWDRIQQGKGRETFDKPISGPSPGFPSLSVVQDNVAANKNDGTHLEFEGRDD